MKRIFTIALVMLFAFSMSAQKNATTFSSVQNGNKIDLVAGTKDINPNQAFYQDNAKAEVTIGTETLLERYPVYAFFGYSYTQSIYLASEINEANSITHISYYFAGTTLSASNNWTIYMGHTTKTQFDNTDDWVDVATLTEVYSGTFADPGGSGWIEFDIADFNYNGTDNLIIAIDENADNYNTSNDKFYNSAVANNRSMVYYSDGTNPDPASPPTAGYNQALIPNIKLMLGAPANDDLSCTDVTPESLQYGETVAPTAFVKNNGVNTQNDFSVTVVINDGTSDVYTSTKAVTGASLAQGNSVEVTMDDNWSPSLGSYTITGTVTLSGDENTDNNTYSGSCNVLNGLWTVSSETMAAMYLGSGAYNTTDNILYSVGGNDASTTLSIYDVVNDSWTTGAALPADMVVGSACYADGFVYVHPGSTGGVYTNLFWIYDEANDTWNDAGATLPASFAWSKMAYCPTHNGIYLAGGNDGSVVLSDVYFYDIANDTWTAATSLPNAVFGGVLAIAEGSLYYLGGIDDTDNLTATVHKGEIDATDPLTITWTTVTDMPYAPYKHHGAAFGEGKIIVNGGNIGTGGSYWTAEASTFVYDIADDSWSQVADKTTPALGGAEGSFFIDNEYVFVVASGYDGSATIDHAEIYAEPFVSTPEYKTINVSISPNPTSGMIRVAANGDYTVEVMDITGKVISSSNMKNETNIDISAQNAGVYIVRLSNETETSSFKVIKK
ncbi:MAG: T9SS type A sorting domain-containing protein [Bacteroidales bacterium]|nr:T9SS type A sorting domain-containing protein [Bacteroidales bacterium]